MLVDHPFILYEAVWRLRVMLIISSIHFTGTLSKPVLQVFEIWWGGDCPFCTILQKRSIRIFLGLHVNKMSWHETTTWQKKQIEKIIVSRCLSEPLSSAVPGKFQRGQIIYSCKMKMKAEIMTYLSTFEFLHLYTPPSGSLLYILESLEFR